MSFNDLTQTEKRSILIATFAMNRACEAIAKTLKKDEMEVKYNISLNAGVTVMQLSDVEVNAIIEQIQQSENEGKPCIISFENTSKN